MSAESILHDMHVCRMGSVSVGLHALVNDMDASMALDFRDSRNACGLSVGFHASTEEVRAFAAELLRYADAADAVVEAKKVSA
jgi:hypothetical protein